MIHAIGDRASVEQLFEILPGSRLLLASPEPGVIAGTVFAVAWVVNKVSGRLVCRESDDRPFDPDTQEIAWVIET